jgi:hypothetical protein
MTWTEADWIDDPEAVVDDRRVYAVVANERTAGELRALLAAAGHHLGRCSDACDGTVCPCLCHHPEHSVSA